MKNDLCEKCGVGIEEAPGGCGCKTALDDHSLSIYWHPDKKKWVSQDEMIVFVRLSKMDD